jgi:hypothetical protein
MAKQKKVEKSGKSVPSGWQASRHDRVRLLARFLANNTPLPEILLISTFILIRWWNNSDFSYPSEIFLPIISLGLLATVVFYVYRFILGPGLAAHLAALSLTYIFYVFQFVENSQVGKFIYGILPSFLSSPFARSLIMVLLLGLFCGAIAWGISKIINKLSFIRQLQPYKVLLFAVIFIFGLQLFRTAGRIYEMRHQLSYEYSASTTLAAVSGPVLAKPDIYYLVFDRYAGPEILNNNLNFDNSEFTDFLAEQGFVTRLDAYSNYPFTTPSVASTMSMHYFPQLEKQFGRDGRWQSAAPYRTILNDPPIAQELKKYGYVYNQVSSWWDFTRIGIKADNDPSKSYRLRVLNHSFWLSDLQRDIFFKSVLSPWFKKGLTLGDKAVLKYDLDRNPSENFEAQMASLKGIASRSDKSAPQFSFAHVLAPHPPYVFDENGNPPPYDGESNDNGADESVKYAKELVYVNKRLKELVTYIKQKSPEAVILIQSDEGPYPKQFRGPMTPDRYYDPIELPQKQMQQKFSIMASYHIPGVPPEELAKLQSSVNMFRLLLNKHFGYKLKMLPDCQLSTGNKFNLYNYTVVNDRLDGGPLPAECRAYE